MTPPRADLILDLKRTIDHMRELLAVRGESIEVAMDTIALLKERIADLEYDLAAERSANGRRQGLRVVGRGEQ